MHRQELSFEAPDVDASEATGVAALLKFLPSLILLLICLAVLGLTFVPALLSRINALRDQEISTLRLVWLLGAVLLAIQSVAVRKLRVGWNGILLQSAVSILLLVSAAAGVELWRAATLAVPTTYTEAIIFISAIRHGGLPGIYALSNLIDAPLLISIYGPFYYSILHWGFAIVGPSVLVGRWISIAAVAAIMMMLFRLDSQKSPWRIFAPLLFLFIFSNFVWGGSLGKPDYVGAAFSFLAVFTYMAWGRRQTPYWVLLPCVCTAIALLIKVSLLAGFFAIAIDLLWSRRYRQAFIYIVGVAVFVLSVYASLWNATSGGIVTMTISANAVHLSPFWALINLRGLFTPVGVLFLVLGAGGSYLLFPRTRSAESWALPSAYFLIAFGWFLVAITRPGSSSSYFVETAIAGTLVISKALSSTEVLKTRVSRLGWTVALIMLLPMMLPQILRASRRYTKDDSSKRIATALAAMPVSDRQYVMADVYYVLDVVESGQQPIINDSAQFTVSSDSGRLSTLPMLKAFESRKVPYAVLIHTPDWHLKQPYGLRFWPASVLLFVKANYDCRSLGPSLIFLNQSRGSFRGDLTICQLKELPQR